MMKPEASPVPPRLTVLTPEQINQANRFALHVLAQTSVRGEAFIRELIRR
ncbi:MAG: hypothetical protein PHS96_14340 [Anaerolineales bacterium]|nr:hypothetical protein [Anaerolineales bacterium]